MKKYESCFGRVKEVEVERETEVSVWIDGRRRTKDSNWQPLFDTEAEAWAHIVRLAKNRVQNARNALAYAEEDLAKAVKRVPSAFFDAVVNAAD